MTTVIVIGDTGGNANVLDACLQMAGVLGNDVPSDRMIIHVGDVVRCHAQFRDGNRESAERIHDLALNNPTNFVQLLGNHESAALGGPARPGWDVKASIDLPTSETLQQLWDTRLIRLAAACDSKEWGPVLVTHAGLTRSRWLELRSPQTAYDAAARVNKDMGAPLPEWARAGSLVREQDGMADTTWAEVNRELDEPWIAAGDAPFSQIHGHASPFNWAANDWWPDAPSEVRSATSVQPSLRRTVTRLAPSRFAISVDWNLGDAPITDVSTWPLLEVEPPT